METPAAAFLSQGSYGCTYRPPLKCDGETTTKDGTITKIMVKEDADEELARVEKIRKVDPEQKYFVFAERSCDRTIRVQNEDADALKECEVLKEVPGGETAKMLVMPDGGENLEVFAENASQHTLNFPQVGKVIASLDNLFEGLQKLHDAGLVHFDIRLPNIVMNSEFKTRFIDFGLTRSTYPINPWDRLYNQEYYPYPYQVHYLSGWFQEGYNEAVNKMIDVRDEAANKMVQVRDEGAKRVYVRDKAITHVKQFMKYLEDTRNVDMIYDRRLDAKGKLQWYFPIPGFLDSELNLLDRMKSDKKLGSEILISSDVYGLGVALASFYSVLTTHKPVGNPMRIESEKYPHLAGFSLRWFTMTENMSRISQEQRWTLKASHHYFKTMILPVLGHKFGSSRKRTKRGKKKGGRTRRKRNFPRVG